MKTADQAVHDYLWKYLSGTMDVYESRPMTDVAYPFADFDDFETGFSPTKSGMLAKVTAVINIWGTEDNRASVSDTAYGLINAVQSVKTMYDFAVSLRPSESSVKVTQDRTVTPPVWRAMVTMVFDI
jgi:hypothetical protein